MNHLKVWSRQWGWPAWGQEGEGNGKRGEGEWERGSRREKRGGEVGKGEIGEVEGGEGKLGEAGGWGGEEGGRSGSRGLTVSVILLGRNSVLPSNARVFPITLATSGEEISWYLTFLLSSGGLRGGGGRQ